jgi:hypothetical protein
MQEFHRSDYKTPNLVTFAKDFHETKATFRSWRHNNMIPLVLLWSAIHMAPSFNQSGLESGYKT